MQKRRLQLGFTLLELVIVVAIIGILVAIAMPGFQRSRVRAQVAEGLSMAAQSEAPVAHAFVHQGEAPLDRIEAGMSATPTDTFGKYVQSVDVQSGVLVITFGNDANKAINGQTVTLTPYETANFGVVWRCGLANAPSGLNTLGTSGGRRSAAYIAPTVPLEYLPAACRP